MIKLYTCVCLALHDISALLEKALFRSNVRRAENNMKSALWGYSEEEYKEMHATSITLFMKQHM